MGKSDNECLWEGRGLVLGDVSRLGNSMWSGIIKAGSDMEKEWVSFGSSFSKEIGDGVGTLFREDKWVGNSKLRDRFPRLYSLDGSRMCRILKGAVGRMGFGLGSGIG